SVRAQSTERSLRWPCPRALRAKQRVQAESHAHRVQENQIPPNATPERPPQAGDRPQERRNETCPIRNMPKKIVPEELRSRRKWATAAHLRRIPLELQEEKRSQTKLSISRK